MISPVDPETIRERQIIEAATQHAATRLCDMLHCAVVTLKAAMSTLDNGYQYHTSLADVHLCLLGKESGMSIVQHMLDDMPVDLRQSIRLAMDEYDTADVDCLVDAVEEQVKAKLKGCCDE